MGRSGFTLLQAIGVLALVLVLAAILFPVFFRKTNRDPTFYCQINLKAIALGMKQYIGDYDEKYPPVSVHSTRIGKGRPYGWADGLQPYIKSLQRLQCPDEPTGPAGDKPTESGYTDYWYNANYARQVEKNFAFVSNTVLLGDGAVGGGNARYSVRSEPNTTPESSRHFDGNAFAFVDAHVKWLKPGQVSATSSPKSGYSFRIK